MATVYDKILDDYWKLYSLSGSPRSGHLPRVFPASGVEWQHVDVGSLVANVIEAQQIFAEQRGHTLVCECEVRAKVVIFTLPPHPDRRP